MTPFIYHSPRTNSKKAYTLVGIIDETQDIATMSFGLSVCSDLDTLNKKIGTAIATGRCKKAPMLVIQLTPEEQKQTLQKFLNFAKSFTPTQVMSEYVWTKVQL